MGTFTMLIFGIYFRVVIKRTVRQHSEICLARPNLILWSQPTAGALFFMSAQLPLWPRFHFGKRNLSKMVRVLSKQKGVLDCAQTVF